MAFFYFLQAICGQKLSAERVRTYWFTITNTIILTLSNSLHLSATLRYNRYAKLRKEGAEFREGFLSGPLLLGAPLRYNCYAKLRREGAEFREGFLSGPLLLGTPLRYNRYAKLRREGAEFREGFTSVWFHSEF